METCINHLESESTLVCALRKPYGNLRKPYGNLSKPYGNLRKLYGI